MASLEWPDTVLQEANPQIILLRGSIKTNAMIQVRATFASDLSAEEATTIGLHHWHITVTLEDGGKAQSSGG